MCAKENEELVQGRPFTELEVWKKMRELKKQIEIIIRTFPESEKYCLTYQLRKSSRSVNSNIAEGHGRFKYPDRIHFCLVARGSLSETHNHLIDAFDLEYINQQKLDELVLKLKEVERILNGYINWLRGFL